MATLAGDVETDGSDHNETSLTEGFFTSQPPGEQPVTRATLTQEHHKKNLGLVLQETERRERNIAVSLKHYKKAYEHVKGEFESFKRSTRQQAIEALSEQQSKSWVDGGVHENNESGTTDPSKRCMSEASGSLTGTNSLPAVKWLLNSSQLQAPGVSQHMFNSVVKENLKMRAHLEGVLQKKGIDFEDFLQTLEYEEVIRKLQQEVHLKTLQLEQVQRTFTQKPGEWVEKQTIVNLQSNIVKLQKTLLVKDTLVESVSKENEKLKDVVKRLVIKIRKNEEMEVSPNNESKISDKAEKVEQVDTQSKNGIIEDDKTPVMPIEEHKAILRDMDLRHKQKIDILLARISSEEEKKDKIEKLYIDIQAKFDELHKRQGASPGVPTNVQQLQSELRRLKMELEASESKANSANELKLVYEIQMTGFQEDYEAERQWRLKDKEAYEEKVTKQQLHIRKLSMEAERVHKMLRDEKEKYRKLEQKYKIFGQDSVAEDSSDWPPAQADKPGVVAYLPRRGGEMRTDGRTEEELLLSCPRCEREFNDMHNYEAHCKKCTDT